MSTQTPTPKSGSPGARRKHRPRRERNPNVRVILTDRDRAVLKLFTMLRVATAMQLFPLVSGDSLPSSEVFASAFVLWKRLRGLYDAGHLARPRGQDLRPGKKQRGGQPDIYALGNRGAAELRAQGLDLPKTDFDQKAKALRPLSFDHMLATSDAVAAFLLAFRACSDKVELVDILPDGKFVSYVMILHGRRSVRIPIKPDATFLMREAGKMTALFLEVDLDTMPGTRSTYEQTSFLKKAGGYLAYYREARRLKDELGVEGFTVLTVTETQTHSDALRTITHRTDPEQRGSDLFWFTTSDALRSDDPLSAPIWTTATGESGSLL